MSIHISFVYNYCLEVSLWVCSTEKPFSNKSAYKIINAYVLSGPGSSVGIVTGYGLDGPGIESRWGRDFPHLSRPALGPTQLPAQ